MKAHAARRLVAVTSLFGDVQQRDVWPVLCVCARVMLMFVGLIVMKDQEQARVGNILLSLETR